ncbi:hypothetical protein VCV18_011518 [Metarhizium anisopliae]
MNTTTSVTPGLEMPILQHQIYRIPCAPGPLSEVPRNMGFHLNARTSQKGGQRRSSRVRKETRTLAL